MKTYTIAQRIKDNNESKEIKGHYDTTTCAVIRSPDTYFLKGLTSSRVGMYSPTFRYATDTVYDSGCSNIFSILDRDLLLGVLASKIYKLLFKAFVNHTVNSQVEDNLGLQVPMVINKAIEKIVQEVVRNQKQNPRYDYASNEQVEIDRLVYAAYGLNEDDITEVENWYARRYPKLARAQNNRVTSKSEI